MLGTEPSAPYRIDSLRSPLFVSWQITRDCDLSCIHCCTGSAPGKRLPDELDAEEALGVAADLIRNEVPYVMLCGGEPLIVPHFLALAQKLGSAGVQLKIETNGQQLRPRADRAARGAERALRSDQPRWRYAGRLRQTTARRVAAPGACGLPACQRSRRAARSYLAPTRLNIHEVRAVIERASALGAFRFSTGRLMRMGTAARRWDKLAPSPEEYRTFRDTLRLAAGDPGGAKIELCYTPFSVVDALRNIAQWKNAIASDLAPGRCSKQTRAMMPRASSTDYE